jgi:hypothetical protein
MMLALVTGGVKVNLLGWCQLVGHVVLSSLFSMVVWPKSQPC